MAIHFAEKYPQIKKYIFWFGKLLSIAAIFFIIFAIVRGGSDIRTHLDFEHAWLLVIAGTLFIGYFILRSLGWHSLCKTANPSNHWSAHAWYLASSEILRYIPGNIWGLGARILKGKRFGISRLQATQLLFEDAINCVGAAGFFCLLCVPFADISRLHLGAIIFISASAFGVFLIYTFFQTPFTKLLQKFFPSIIFMTLALQSRAKIFVTYVFQWLLFGLANVLVSKSIAPDSSIETVLLVGVFSWLIGYISLITPMGLGVREGVFTTLLTAKTVFAVVGFISILSRIILIVSELAFYLIAMLGFRRYEKKYPNSNWSERGS